MNKKLHKIEVNPLTKNSSHIKPQPVNKKFFSYRNHSADLKRNSIELTRFFIREILVINGSEAPIGDVL